MKIYICPVCGNVIFLMDGDIKRVRCCGTEMVEMKANDVEASIEKHIPYCEVTKDMVKVRVGETIHPMDKDHYIMWIAIVNDDKYEIKSFNPGDEPVCEFNYTSGTVYAYCNKHGLWKKEL